MCSLHDTDYASDERDSIRCTAPRGSQAELIAVAPTVSDTRIDDKRDNGTYADLMQNTGRFRTRK